MVAADTVTGNNTAQATTTAQPAAQTTESSSKILTKTAEPERQMTMPLLSPLLMFFRFNNLSLDFFKDLSKITLSIRSRSV